MADLRQQLQAIDIPGDSAGEERSWRLIDAAFDELRPSGTDRISGRHRLRWLGASALALIAGTAFALTPAGAEVREWLSNAVDDVGEPDAKPSSDPSSGPRLPARSDNRRDTIVRDDGSTRTLGEFDDVGWSPHGLYVAAVERQEFAGSSPPPGRFVGRSPVRTGSATPPGPRMRASGSPTGAAKSCGRLGRRNQRREGRASKDVVPAWQPRTGHRNILAYADRIGRVRIVDVDSGRVLARGWLAGGPDSLDWTRDGSQLLLVYRANAQVLDAKAAPAADVRLRPGRFGPLGRLGSFLPGTEAVAALLRSDAPRPVSKVVFGAPLGDNVSKRTIFTGSGRLRGLTVAPNGRQVLVGWPRADQWLFIPTLYTNRIEAVDNIRRQFSEPGATGFPGVAGWCCQAG